MSSVKKVVVQKAWNLQEHLSGQFIVSISIGPENDRYILSVKLPPDGNERDIFSRIQRDTPKDFLVLKIHGDRVVRCEIKNQLWTYHRVQPLPENQILLVCARSRRRSDSDFDLNAKVFSKKGILLREFLLGDGIEDVQATKAGHLWVSYFDEGIFGNYGWTDPIGVYGLIKWNGYGKELFHFTPSERVDPIDDCYAINIPSEDEAWCYYYSRFSLVRIVKNKIVGSWKCPISGSHHFAVNNNLVLIGGGYDQPDLYHLYRLKDNNKMEVLPKFRFVDEENKILRTRIAAARGSLFYLSVDTRIFKVDLLDLLEK